MSNLKNTYGFSQSLLDAIRSVQENALKGNQSKLDANKNGKIDAEDFKKLRAMKKEEIEQFNEYLSEASPASLASLGNAAHRALDTAHELRRSAGSTMGSTKGFDGHQNKLSDKHIEIAKHHIKALGNAVGAPETAAATIAHVDKLHAAMKQSQIDRYNDEDFDDDNDPADHHHYNAASGILKLMHKTHNEEVDLEEGGMPSSVIRSKQKYAAMTNQEFADLHGHKTEEQLRQMAWSHGYGKMSPHYWNRVQKAKATQMKEEAELD